ncbi:MAG TPA: C4-type zinc ribbon domain-containing protein [Vicinamibacterales bacterium]|nr:C4-type zinc ribbon domain-containing protein [Vicinamibacterales bacterium]
MSPDLERLIQLQRLETIITEARAAIALHPQKLASLDSRLNEVKAAVDSAKEQLKANGERRRELEKDVAVYQGRLTKFKDQLSAVKTNREYTAMQHEIATAQTDLGTVEEKVLERMLEADDLTAAAKRAEADLAAQSKEIEAEKKTLSQEVTSTEASLKQSTEARAALVKALEPRLVALFEQVAKVRKGVAICSATRDGLCSVCHVRLRPHVFQQIRQNDTIIQCDSCQRVMYWIPPPPPVEPPVVHAP